MAGRLSRPVAQHLAAIRLEQVGVRLGGRWVLREVSCELREGERWLLTGANGAGKTLLLKLLCGDLWPTPTRRGRRLYRCDGEWHESSLEARTRIAHLGPERQDRYERHGIDAPVADIVATGFTHDDLLLEPPTAAQWRAVRHVLAAAGLAGLAGRRFLALSHGQRRRVLLARALVGRPDVLLLDEALDGLDAGSRRLFLRSLRHAGGRQLAWVLATHRAAERPPGITHLARIEAGRLSVVGADAPGAVHPAPPRRKSRPATARRQALQRPAAPECAAPLLQLRQASVYRDGRRVLGPLDWTIGDGEHWCVLGPNGAGKSTLLELLYGDFAPATGGSIERRDCPRGTPIESWKQRVGIVSPGLQSTFAATGCTAEEIVVSGLRSSVGLDGAPTAAERSRARRWLARVGLRGFGRCRARELSHGQLRRALVARALVAERRLLLLDEPFDGIDAGARAVVLREVERTARRGAQVVIATHHPEDVPSWVGQRLSLAVRRPGPAR